MSLGDISSDEETVGVAVVNFPAVKINSEKEVIDNAKRIAEMIYNTKTGLPGLDLIIFPEYSLQGFNPKKWRELSLPVESEAVDIIRDAARSNGIWAVFTLTGELNEEPRRNPYDTAIMIASDGKIVLKYRKIMPWVPIEPWYPGNSTHVAEGPKGIKVGAMICDDGNYPEIWRDLTFKGAELIIRVQGYMYPPRDQVSIMSKAMAWANNTYVAVSNLAGYDNTYYYFGHSMLVSFDGRVLGEAGESPNEVIYGQLSIPEIRRIRKNWTAENHLYKLLHRGYTATRMAGESEEGISDIPYDFYKMWVNDPTQTKKLIEMFTYSKPKFFPKY